MALWNTVKTTMGFVKTLITRYTPLDLSDESLEGIFNYLPINDDLVTSGQPTESQFAMVKAAGFDHVINLAPHNTENALADEAATLAELDIRYTHIPVNWQAPKDADFARFCDAIEAAGDNPVWVHCAANMRVSAFIFRYRCEVQGLTREEARKDLHKIWEPFGVWKEFTGE